MQITQEQTFVPIFIKLETPEEAAALWDLVQARAAYSSSRGLELTSINELCQGLHNYFDANLR